MTDALAYVGRRLLQLVLVLFVAGSVNFLIPRLLPGDPVAAAVAKMQSGGGSNAIGLFAGFLDDDVELVGVEAANAASLGSGRAGVLHGARSSLLADEDGQVLDAESISAGLDYPGVGPQIAALVAAGRVELTAATDADAVASVWAVARSEGILPAVETAHAFAVLPRLLAGTEGAGEPLPRDAVVLVGLSGRGDKDLAAIERFEADR